MDQKLSLSIQRITKTYPGVVALNDVSIDFREGEVHAAGRRKRRGKVHADET